MPTKLFTITFSLISCFNYRFLRVKSKFETVLTSLKGLASARVANWYGVLHDFDKMRLELGIYTTLSMFMNEILYHTLSIDLVLCEHVFGICDFGQLSGGVGHFRLTASRRHTVSASSIGGQE